MKKSLTTVTFCGTPEQEAKLVEIIAGYKDVQGSMMPIMQEAQNIYGYLPIEVMQIIARETGAPMEEIEELYDFYNEVGLPTTFADLGIADATDEDIMKVAETSMHSYWDVEPFSVNPRMIADGIKMANVLGLRLK